jgi:hypothetical protein
MKKLILAGFVLIVLMACNKDKYQTKPQISLKSISNSVVVVNGGTTIALSYTDKEGDISDSLFFIKKRLNQTVVKTDRDTIAYPIPSFPNYDKGEIDMALTYQNDLVSAETPPPIQGSNPSVPQPDTLVLKIWIHDKAGHSSDTVTTSPIVVLRQ